MTSPSTRAITPAGTAPAGPRCSLDSDVRAPAVTRPGTDRRRDTPKMPELPLEPGERYRFHFDVSRCIGCRCCEVACEEQNAVPHDARWRTVGTLLGGEYPFTRQLNLSTSCHHCEEPACLEVCPVDAYSISSLTGIVLHSQDQCIGCQYCTWACPYGAPRFNPERNVVGKCDMCHARLERGQAPACVAACPSEAIAIEKVERDEIRVRLEEARAPGLPDPGFTIASTRFTLPTGIPEALARVSDSVIEPQHAHVTLIVMTILTQLAVGGCVALWLAQVLTPGARAGHAGWLLQHLSLPMLAVCALALGVATLHLGRPIHAYRALRMWRRSWLSREIALFSLFGGAGTVHALVVFGLGAAPRSWVVLSSGAAMAAIGVAGLYSTARIYMVPARPAWCSWHTVAGFLLTAMLLGSLFAALLLAAGLVHFAAAPEQWVAVGLVPWLVLAALASAAILSVRVGQVMRFAGGQALPELQATARMLLDRFRRPFAARLALSLIGGIGLPVWAAARVGDPLASRAGLVAIIAMAALTSLAAEVLGRYLFFVAVVPRTSPGPFAAGGAHA